MKTTAKEVDAVSIYDLLESGSSVERIEDRVAAETVYWGRSEGRLVAAREDQLVTIAVALEFHEKMAYQNGKHSDQFETDSGYYWLLWKENGEQMSDHPLVLAKLMQNNEPESGDGVERKMILAAIWPLRTPYTMMSLGNSLSDTPKWLKPARTSVGRPGKGSSLWNPAVVAECLARQGHADPRDVSSFIDKNFPEWPCKWKDYL